MSAEEIFRAVTTELRASPEAEQRDSWKSTVVALFADVFESVKVNPDRVPPAKKRYPLLKGVEPALLLIFFEQVSVVDSCTFEQWCGYARTISRDLYNTT
uniref:Uncharacterized protein n=1 Tax=Peronospora matthiolae TaxID=2874970 RepID=A0AAV1VCH4_9STRA